MLSRLGPRRVRASSDVAWSVTELDGTDGSSMPEEVDALASRGEDGTLAVLVWRHTDDQYQTDDEPAVVQLAVDGMDDGDYRLSHHRIDSDHSNSHTVWQQLGSPQDPTEEQLAAIKKRQGLEELTAPRTVRAQGRVSLEVSLPLPSVSLLIFTPQR
jgi:xylan 1,4-beta-xylosidase